jgi:lipid-binding SYLF domain-containing protein
MKIRICLISAVCVSAALAAERGPADRLHASAEVFSEIMSTPDKGVPQDLLDKSACIVIIPGLKKGAFVIGGSYGKGFISCRKESGVGWSAPGAVRMEGGSFGLQIGGAETDVIMLVLNRGGVERLLGSRFTLGGDASVAAGPVGRDTSAQTDARMTAQILTYSRQRGVFAGVSLKGSTLREDDGWNKAMYGREMHNKEIVLGSVAPPAGSQELLAALNKHSSRK